MPKLTKRVVESAPARSQRYELSCDSLAGFLLRVLPSGKKVFYVRYRRGGRSGGQRRVRIGVYGEQLTVSEARKIARKYLAEVAQGRDPGGAIQARRKAPTFKEVAERYMAEHVALHCKPATHMNFRILLKKHLYPRLATLKVDEIRRVDINRVHKAIGRETPGAANRALTMASAIFNHAELWELRPQHSNPTRGVKRFKERKIERFLSPEERVTLEKVLRETELKVRGEPGYVSPGAVSAIRLLLLTGARLSEITGLTWDMVNWQQCCFRLPDSKTGAKDIIVAKSTMQYVRELYELREPGCVYVCPSETGKKLQNMQRVWISIRKRAGIEDVRLHDLRHSAASDALAAGIPLEFIGAMLGHKSVQTTQRYAHLADRVLRAAVETTTRRILANSGEDEPTD